MRPRAVILALACTVFLLFSTACGNDLVTEPEVVPQLAKGGNGKGKDNDPGDGGEATLEEFWVYTVDGVDYVHMVASGGVDAVKKSVAYDHFFNGGWDGSGSLDQHYEFFFSGAPTPQSPLGDGVAHADYPFHGDRTVEGYPYPDYPATSVNGSGADPFAFSVGAYNGTDKRGSWRPIGVVHGSETFTPEWAGPEGTGVVGTGHTETHLNVRSYATFQGATPAGALWVEDLQFESARCSTRTVKEGHGKNATRTSVTTVTGDISVTFGRDPALDVVPSNPEWEYVWWEGHFVDPVTGVMSERVRPPSDDGGAWTLVGDMPDGWSGGSLEFVVDYLYPSASPGVDGENYNGGTFADYVYDPSRNNVGTTAGLSGENWTSGTASTQVGDQRFPVAHSAQTIQVGCGG